MRWGYGNLRIGNGYYVSRKVKVIIFFIMLAIGLWFGHYSSFVCNDKVCEIQNENHMHVIIKRQHIDIDNVEQFSYNGRYLYAVMKNGEPIKLIPQGIDKKDFLMKTAIRMNEGLKQYRDGNKNIDIFLY